jgi:hypothetical protein
MHHEPEHEDYDDDEYKYYPDGGQFNEYNEHGYPKEFQIDWAAWEEWLKDAMSDIIKEKDDVWLVGNNLQNKGSLSDKCFVYLGNNNYDEAIWKIKYFINDKIDQQYKKHIQSHASYFVQQPEYYKGLYDNLN